MRFCLSWLLEYLETSASLEQIVNQLTSIGLEVEEVVDNAAALKPFLIAEILEAAPHPNATKLQVCKVHNGTETLQIVCGAPNARAGIKVVLAPIGTIMPNGLHIKASTIREVMSHGMLCSAAELGLGADKAGIIELPQDAPVGKHYALYARLDDPIIEVSITPNRGDCMSVYGIARDLAASGIGHLKPLSSPSIKATIPSPVSVEITDATECRVFFGRYFRNVKNGESPAWMKKRLESAGLKPISTLVDITNYINIAYGRPLHVYDADQLDSHLVVRKAKAEEEVHLLNDKHYKVNPSIGVIASGDHLHGVAGIMGGYRSQCHMGTTNVFLEGAVFDAVAISESGQKLTLPSDARQRFERGVDAAFTKQGILLASDLILSLCGGETSEVIQSGEVPPSPLAIQLPLSLPAKVTGVELTVEQMNNALQKLGCTVKQANKDILEVTPPTWRNDLREPHDMVEEIIRIHGYHHIPAASMPLHITRAHDPAFAKEERVHRLRKLMATRGMAEMVSFSFMAKEKASLFAPIQEELTLTNPISQDLSFMRSTTLGNLLEAIARNQARGFHDLQLFEVGPHYKGAEHKAQHLHLTSVLAGHNHPRDHKKTERPVDFYDAKSHLFAALHASGLNPERAIRLTRDVPSYYHPGKSAALVLGKSIIGYCGALHPLVTKAFDIKREVIGFELNLEVLPLPRELKPTFKPYAPSNYQKVTRDFAFVIDRTLMVGEILQSIRDQDKNLITEVELFDVYQGNHVQADQKSIALRVTFQAPDRTLEENEIANLCQSIITMVANTYKGTLRSA